MMLALSIIKPLALIFSVYILLCLSICQPMSHGQDIQHIHILEMLDDIKGSGLAADAITTDYYTLIH